MYIHMYDREKTESAKFDVQRFIAFVFFPMMYPWLL